LGSLKYFHVRVVELEKAVKENHTTLTTPHKALEEAKSSMKTAKDLNAQLLMEYHECLKESKAY
jgi:hypothetical protein